jgi:hypothetical protein
MLILCIESPLAGPGSGTSAHPEHVKEKALQSVKPEHVKEKNQGGSVFDSMPPLKCVAVFTVAALTLLTTRMFASCSHCIGYPAYLVDVVPSELPSIQLVER